MQHNHRCISGCLILFTFLFCFLIYLGCASKENKQEEQQAKGDEPTKKENVKEQTARDPSKIVFQTRPAKNITKDNQSEIILFRINTLSRVITLNKTGGLTIEETGVDTYKMNLFQDSLHKINIVNYATYQNDLILCYQLDEKGKGRSEITRLNLDIKKIIWQTHFGGINLSPAILNDKFLYGTTLGYVGVIDLNIGDIVWEKKGLWEKHQVNSFYRIGLSQDTVMFIGKVFARLDNTRMTTKNIVLKYNKHNGDEL